MYILYPMKVVMTIKSLDKRLNGNCSKSVISCLSAKTNKKNKN